MIDLKQNHLLAIEVEMALWTAGLSYHYVIALRILTLEINVDRIDSFGVKEVAIIMTAMYHPPHTSMVFRAESTHRDRIAFGGCTKQVVHVNEHNYYGIGHDT